MKRILFLLCFSLMIPLLSGCGTGSSSSSLAQTQGAATSGSSSSTGHGGSSTVGTSSGSGSSSSSNTVTYANGSTFATAVVQVDLVHNSVKVTSGSSRAAKASRAVYMPQAVTVSAPQTLVNDPGDPTIQAIQISLADNLSVAVGAMPSGTATGIKAILTGYTNIMGQSSDSIHLSNADGTLPATNQPYLNYTMLTAAPISSGTATAVTRTWNFIVPSGITGFTFALTIEGAAGVESPPQAALNMGATLTEVRTYAGQFGKGAVAGPVDIVDGLAQNARFSALHFIAADGAGNVYVTDNNAVRFIGPSGTVTTILNPTDTVGDTPSYLAPINGTVTAATGVTSMLSNAQGIAVNSAGTILYVADSGNNQVRRIALSTTATTPSVALNWTVSIIAGSSIGAAGDTDGLGLNATLNKPTGVALDAFGNVYITESAGNRVRRISFLGGDPTNEQNYNVVTVAGGASGHSDGTGAAASFKSPTGIACDRTGNLYVADSGNNTIRYVTAQGVVTTLAGIVGQAKYADAAVGTQATFSNPTGLTVDGAGYVYICDDANLIRRMNTTNSVSGVTSANDVETVAGLPAAGAVDGAGNIAQFNGLTGIAVDPSGNLYVTDTKNSTIRLVQRSLP